MPTYETNSLKVTEWTAISELGGADSISFCNVVFCQLSSKKSCAARDQTSAGEQDLCKKMRGGPLNRGGIVPTKIQKEIVIEENPIPQKKVDIF